MGKKKNVKRKPTKHKYPGEQVSQPKEIAGDNDEKPLDFGGLPERNLKKNLGC